MLISPSDGIISVGISYDGKLIASGSWDCTLNVYNAKDLKQIISKPNYHTGSNICSLKGVKSFFEGVISSLVFTKNNRFLISGSFDASIKIMDLNALSEPVIELRDVTMGNNIKEIAYISFIFRWNNLSHAH